MFELCIIYQTAAYEVKHLSSDWRELHFRIRLNDFKTMSYAGFKIVEKG